jgi:hypothetical protein
MGGRSERPPACQPARRSGAICAARVDRRGPTDKADLWEHYCGRAGKHEWWPEDFDQALSELLEGGFVEDVDGILRRTVGPPL